MTKTLPAFLVLAFLVSCGGGGGSGEGTVVLSHYFTGTLSAGIEELSLAYRLENKAIDLVVTPLEHETFKQAIRLQLDGPNPPDLFSYWAGAKTASLVKAGLIQNLEPVYQRLGQPLPFDPALLAAVSYQGARYMVPLTRHFVGFFYNKAIFAAAGINEPRTWTEFLTVLDRLSRSGTTALALGAKNRWPAQFWFDYLLLRTAPFEFRQDLMAGTRAYTSPEVRRVFGLWADLLNRAAFNVDWQEKDWDDAAEDVLQGRAAMTLMGTWFTAYSDTRKAQYDKDFGFFPFPELEAGLPIVSLGPVDGILLSAKSKSVSQAQEVLEKFAAVPLQSTFNKTSGSLAPNRGVLDSSYSPLQLRIKDIVAGTRHWAFNYDLATDPAIAERGLDLFIAFMKGPERLDALLTAMDNNQVFE